MSEWVGYAPLHLRALWKFARYPHPDIESSHLSLTSNNHHPPQSVVLRQMFNNSSRISVSGGNNSVVNGNQVNYYARDRRRFLPGEEWKEEVYREYERMPRGKIRLISTISEAEVEGESYENPRRLTEESETSQAKRVLHLACTVNGTRESPPFLVVKYAERDANRMSFEEIDVLQFSRLNDPVFPQLRGFNDSEIPMVIFHDLLVPARHALEYTQNSPVTLCYLRMQGEAAVSNLPPTTTPVILACLTSNVFHSGHIWIRPQTGDVCLGPAGPWLSSDHGFLMWRHLRMSPHYPHLGRSPLPLSA
ncbi:hypothetical protein PM082_016998 [Marasmius tenuissimus]|nr:hypothetical protein PM082_016998 [Marasmius tenuissimus]